MHSYGCCVNGGEGECFVYYKNNWVVVRPLSDLRIVEEKLPNFFSLMGVNSHALGFF